MNTLYNKRIILGISGSIAAYKSADLCSRLRQLGAEVRVIMTTAATQFITPMTLQALSGNPVHTELMDDAQEAAMGHIELARWADLILIAPASADCIARLCAGRANDLLGAVCLASTARVAIAPAMNQQMWGNAATQANIETLQQRQTDILGPAEGLQACGDNGPGRMLEPQQLLQACNDLFASAKLAGKKVIISAGPTREPIDPVRFISNRSSGKMGYALAQAASDAGAEVTLVSGPVHIAAPDRVSLIEVETAQQMHQAIMQHADTQDIFIATAAVADYRPGLQSVNKIKKQQSDMQLRLVRTQDILSEVSALDNRPFCVGFAAETENLLEYARKKLQQKNLDLVIANPVGPQQGFDQDDNEVHIISSDSHDHIPLMNKQRLARELITIINEKLHAKHTIKNTGQKTRP